MEVDDFEISLIILYIIYDYIIFNMFKIGIECSNIKMKNWI